MRTLTLYINILCYNIFAQNPFNLKKNNNSF